MWVTQDRDGAVMLWQTGRPDHVHEESAVLWQKEGESASFKTLELFPQITRHHEPECCHPQSEQANNTQPTSALLLFFQTLEWDLMRRKSLNQAI